MTDELAGLPEDVREAIEMVESMERDLHDDRAPSSTLRTDFALLARENAELRKTVKQDRIISAVQNDELKLAAAELADSRKHANTMFLDARDWATRYGEMEARAERAEAELVGAGREIEHQVKERRKFEAELAALKRRIAEAVETAKHGGGSI